MLLRARKWKLPVSTVLHCLTPGHPCTSGQVSPNATRHSWQTLVLSTGNGFSRQKWKMETKLYDGWKTARKQWTVNLFFCKATCQTIVYYQSPSSLTSFYLSLFPKIAPSQSNLRFPNELLYLWRFPFFFILLKTRSYCFNLALSRCILFINELPNVSKTYPLFFYGGVLHSFLIWLNMKIVVGRGYYCISGRGRKGDEKRMEGGWKWEWLSRGRHGRVSICLSLVVHGWISHVVLFVGFFEKICFVNNLSFL